MENGQSNSSADGNSAEGNNSPRRRPGVEFFNLISALTRSGITTIIGLATVFILIGEMSSDIKNLQGYITKKEGAPTIASNASNARDYWDIDISQEDIDRLLEGRTVDCEMRWFILSVFEGRTIYRYC